MFRSLRATGAAAFFTSVCLAALTTGCSTSDATPGTGSDDGGGSGGHGPAGGGPSSGGAQASGAGGKKADGRGSGKGGDSSGSAGSSGSGGAMAGSGGAASSGGQGGATPNLGTVVPPGDPGSADVALDVHADQGARAISPYIYGTNGATDIGKNRQTIVRSGGNRLTAYNWENNASNAGSDWQFQNDGLISDSNSPGKPISDGVGDDESHGAASIVTIPIVDYVSADKNGGGDVRNSGSDYLKTRFKKNHETKGSAFTTSPDANDGDVYQDEFVAFLKGAHPNAKVVFSLDNEPDLWSHTHAEVHPDPVSYSELWDRNHRYAKSIKAVWPESKVLGFVSYGYTGYVNLQNAPDSNKGNFIEWYLDQAKAAEQTDGKRVIDYLDLHWYPEATGNGVRITNNDNSDAVVAAREQAPRSLWDTSYTEKSWIVDSVTHGPIDLLHWLKQKIDAHYPGTVLAFTEWNFGGSEHISGCIAASDVLGVFGREGVGIATYWGLGGSEAYPLTAYRVYRNYDGNGATFGDTSVAATSSDIPNATVYGSIDAANPKRTVIVAINKATSTKTAGIRLYHSTKYATAKVYVVTSAGPDVKPAAALTAVATNAFKYTMPAQSVSVIVPTE